MCHLDLQKNRKGLTELFYGWEMVEEISWFCDLLIFKRLHLQQLKAMQSSKRGM